MPRTTLTLSTATAGLLAAALLTAAPSGADPVDDAFLTALDSANIAMTNPQEAISLGQSVCPMLSQPGQTAADAAAKVADTAGMPLGPATMFTGLAISAFCPAAVAQLGSGQALNSLPLGLFGF
jgi:peptidoglycan biosynthesis protein MviN/MurJ (putative lipid II flippase)